MMRIDRRAMLKAAAVLGAAAGAPIAAARAVRAGQITFFDSRIAESRSFAAGRAGAARIDLAAMAHDRGQALRRRPAPGAAVEGLTLWSDWTVVRGELQALGWRVTEERRIAAPISGRAQLFRWSMKPRAAAQR